MQGRIKMSVTRAAFGPGANIEDCCREAARLGYEGFDSIRPADWPTVRKYGLVPTTYGIGDSVAEGLNRKENHDKLGRLMHAAIDVAAASGVPNIVTFSGNRDQLDDRAGADNTVAFLDQVKAHAEDKQITICMENLNSKVDHADYMFDHIAWGVDVMRRVDSPRVKILFDIYHAQIMDGDVVRNLRDHQRWIGHIHAAGVPGRHEIDDDQELNYPFILRAIGELGYAGFVGLEYFPGPQRDPIAGLARAIQLRDQQS